MAELCSVSLSCSSVAHSNPQHRDALPEQGAGWAVLYAASQRDIPCKKVFMSLCQVPRVLPECASGLYGVSVLETRQIRNQAAKNVG